MVIGNVQQATASRAPSDPTARPAGPKASRLPSLSTSNQPSADDPKQPLARRLSRKVSNKTALLEGLSFVRKISKVAESCKDAVQNSFKDGTPEAITTEDDEDIPPDIVTTENEVTKPGIKWGLLPNWEELDPKNPQLPEIHYACYGKTQDRTANVVFLLTNAIRKEAEDVFTLLRICQAKRFLLTHDHIADLYIWFSDSVSIVSSVVDLIMDKLLPTAEEKRPLDGQLAPDQRAVHQQWIKTAADVMKESQLQFTRRLPAGEQFPGLLHAAFGFTFPLDFSALVDRQVPKRLEELSRRKTRKFERSILMAMTGVKCSSEEHAPMDTLAVLTRWMNRDQRIIFRRRFFSPTDVLRRLRKSGLGSSYRQVQVMLKHLGDDDKQEETVAIRIDPRKYGPRKPEMPLNEGDIDEGEKGVGDSQQDDEMAQTEGDTPVWIIENVFNFEDDL
jgi:hypothetical protein